jgi:hypothetical protein
MFCLSALRACLLCLFFPQLYGRGYDLDFFFGGVSSDRLCICRYDGGLMSKWRQKLGNTWGVYSEGVCGMGRLEARKAYTCYDDE